MDNDLQILTTGRNGRWDEEEWGTRSFSDVPVTLATTTEQAVEIIHTLGPGIVAMDTETVYADKVDPFTADLRVISIATEAEDGTDISYVFDVKDMDRAALGKAFQDRATALGLPRLRMVGFNANFDDPVTTRNLRAWEEGSGKTYRPLFDWTDLMFAMSLMRLGAAGNRWWGLARSVKKYTGLDLDGKGGVQLSYDAETPLTEDQVRYAANDAIATLWLGDALMEPMQRMRLLEVFTLECGARPFLLGMTVHGLPFNEEGWMDYIATSKVRRKEIEDEIAALTGGQPDLFGTRMLGYKLGSPDDVRKMLNEHFPEMVEAYLADNGGGSRTELIPSDSVDKDALGLMRTAAESRELDTTVLGLLLEHSALAKLESTYGTKMMAKLGEDSRFHSNFTQCQIETGRTSSSSPNAQNFAPAMKPFFNPPPRVDEDGVSHERVILHADYSQAELRTSAQLTGEPVRRHAFEAKEDQHVAVAAKMFNVDMAELKEGNEDQRHRFKNFRARAKTINFGLAYGMRGGQLGRRLTLQGVPTTKEEATKLIDDFFKALPVEAKWLGKRDKYVDDIAEAVSYGLEAGSQINFDLTMQLYRAKARIGQAQSRLPKGQKTDPDAILDELFPSGSMLGGGGNTGQPIDRERWIRNITWALSYDAAVVLCTDGTPWEFYSLTLAGRRRVFQVSTESLLDELATSLASPRTENGQMQVDAWADKHGIAFATNPHSGGVVNPHRRGLGFGELRRLLSADKARRAQFAADMLDTVRGKPYYPRGRSVPIEMADFLQRAAMAKCIRRLANAYRNAPIQGTVADAALLAFGRLGDLLDQYPTAYPITTVHDSIAIEVDAEEAEEIAAKMHAEMVGALARYVPDVPIVVDLDILTSLSEDDLAELPAAA